MSDGESSPLPRPTADGPRARRTRTDMQQAQKRLGDRTKKKVNRAESKLRMERIEKNVLFLREHLEALTSQPCSVQPGLTRHLGYRGDSDTDSSALIKRRKVGGWPALWKEIGAGGVRRSRDLRINSASGLRRASGGLPEAHHTYPPLPTLGLRTGLAYIFQQCGIEHSGRSACLEYSFFSILYQTHIVLSQNPHVVPRLPRDPSLANLLDHSKNDNPLISALASVSENFGLANTEIHFGLYLIAYRLLRWRLYPDQQTLNDVPVWLRPSDVQKSTPHPISIDFLPWPELRDYLCLNQNKDSRHNVALYIKSIQLLWPAGKQLLCKNSHSEFVINRDFEFVACDIRCWRLGFPWLAAFPQLCKTLRNHWKLRSRSQLVFQHCF
ncbi:hypothetical protein GE09DRAFT_979802 [Coniochaeta sp. 2T2.1]|nr:hypothetical protein GE09DRAFT_979802 [Coniochaeta sp. 2T2.1]